MTPYFETKLGKLYHGDCLNIIPELESVDLVLTDPPYGMNYDKMQDKMSKVGRISNKGKWKTYDDDWDIKITDDCLNAIFNISKNQIIWGGQYYSLKSNQKWLIWNKIQRSVMTDGEMAWTSFKKGLHIFDISRTDAYINKTDGKFHPTQKPVQLFQWCLLLLSKINDLILDPFIGSGTTAIACERLKRKWIGIEIGEKYCEIAAKRIEENLTMPERIERSEKDITKKKGLLF